MRVKTIHRFSDLNAKKVREVGDEFDVNEERFGKLDALKLVEVVKVAEVKKTPKKEKGE